MEKIFLGCDLSTAEDRITKVRSKSPRLIERARLHPSEWDEHKFTATFIYHKGEDEIAKTERYAAKRFRHGTNYGIQAAKVSDEFLKDGFVVTTEECQDALDSVLRLDPEIHDYQRRIRMELMSDTHRVLKNSWGREISFEFNRMDDDLYRRGYAWKPQSECAEIMKEWGQIPAHALFTKQPTWGRINQNGHDSLLMSVLPTKAWDIAVYLQMNLEQSVDYDGVELTIPVEFQLGLNWKMQVEYKVLPSRSEMMDAAVELWEKCWNRKWSAK